MFKIFYEKLKKTKKKMKENFFQKQQEITSGLLSVLLKFLSFFTKLLFLFLLLFGSVYCFCVQRARIEILN